MRLATLVVKSFLHNFHNYSSSIFMNWVSKMTQKKQRLRYIISLRYEILKKHFYVCCHFWLVFTVAGTKIACKSGYEPKDPKQATADGESFVIPSNYRGIPKCGKKNKNCTASLSCQHHELF